MTYPTPREVDNADRHQICRWYRFLPQPKNDGEIKIMDRICERFAKFGGFTPEISKALGWTE